MYTPIPSASYVVRNYSKLNCNTKELLQAKKDFQQEDFVKDFLKVELPALETIEEIDESFRQHLFAQWVSYVDKPTPRFNELKTKLKNIIKKKEIIETVRINPADFRNVEKEIGEMMTEMKFNDTAKVKLVVPQDFRMVLFKDWENLGMRFVPLLFHYGRNLGIDPNIYKGDKKFLFKPPPPQKKPFNGFFYKDSKLCTFTNLFAHTDEEVIAEDPSMDATLLELSRTSATFTIFTIFLIVLGFIFTVYTFFNPRYMFKRLAGGVHFISGVTSAIVCRVMMMMINHSEEFLSSKFPRGSKFEWGYGLYFGQAVAAINFFSAIMFLWYSKKKKGDKAATEELGMADEPINIGR